MPQNRRSSKQPSIVSLALTTTSAIPRPWRTSLAGLSRQLEQLDRDLRIANETAALHARFHLAVTPLLPAAAQGAACALGAERFEEFAAQVGRRVDLGIPLIRETIDRVSATRTALCRWPRESHQALDPRFTNRVFRHRAWLTTRLRILLPSGRTAATVAFQAVQAALFTDSATCRGSRKVRGRSHRDGLHQPG